MSSGLRADGWHMDGEKLIWSDAGAGFLGMQAIA